MEQEQFKKYIHEYLKLLSLYLNKKEAKDFVIDKEKISFFYKISKYHSLRAIFYQVISTLKLDISQEYLSKLEQYYLLNVRKSVSFDEERKVLFGYLNEHGIDYLPLKGIIIKEYYPDPLTREFADNDILFDEKKDKLVKEFFVKRDYEVEGFRKSNHDVYQKKPFFNFEMHRALFGETGDNGKIIKYFNGYLNKSLIKENKEHYLSDEDFYIYFTVHSYKHYHNSGCGIRTLIDYYLYLKNTKLDFDYINKELEKLDLVAFSNQIRSISKKVFDDEELNEEEEQVLLYIASSGTYGTLEHSVAKGVKAKGKFGYMMSRIFPPYLFYKYAYRWAYNCPILIPVAWTIRFFRIVFKNPKKAKNELKTIQKYKEKEE